MRSVSNFDYLFPEVKQFKSLLNTKDRVDPPVSTQNLFSEHVSDFDDFPFEPEANTPDGLIPSSYLENGVRKVIVWDMDIETRYILKDGHIVLDDRPVF